MKLAAFDAHHDPMIDFPATGRRLRSRPRHSLRRETRCVDSENRTAGFSDFTAHVCVLGKPSMRIVATFETDS